MQIDIKEMKGEAGEWVMATKRECCLALFNTPPQDGTPPEMDPGASRRLRNVRRRSNFWRSRGLVKMLAMLSRVWTYCSVMFSF